MRHELQAALGHLLEVLKAGGVVLQYPARKSAIEQELTRFDAHMRYVSDNTRRKRCRVVEGFLVEHFDEQPISMATVSATSIRRFVLGKQGRRPATVAANGVIIGLLSALPQHVRRLGRRSEGRDPQGRTLAVGITA
ncbi:MULTISPECIES: hypothetical protein [Mesorhizobium]|uniref:Uncharacterized protein n=3 Tax=Mesorhizobium TaxID=68287 RepID=A0ABZ0VIT6_9HYPH|nr:MULTISPECIES: hypothetical protein [Mesorhizobium]MBZ9910425.1 hypothetical protein [Mesorhizobium sp. BR115XR7A]QGX80636.1 hypothetical protein EB234_30345 [Mesorhizobium japonicum R7A]QJF04781.1 hypothetical protein R7A2020_29940 [Mesorhizobium japonicum R7A]QJF10850.1 hypothetical protein HID05_29930 [Mesorhizobium japonicum]QJI86723.1 hypothetical protein HKB46_29940 [Mesorhizobium japonicum]